MGRLIDRHREQARTGEWCTPAGDWSAVRPPSRAGSLPQGIRVRFRFSPLNRPSVSSPAALDLDPPAPSRPEPLRQPVATSIGASINVDPRRVKAHKSLVRFQTDSAVS
jgi:hypothetical protein